MQYNDDPWYWRMWLIEWWRIKTARIIVPFLTIPGAIIAISQGKLLEALGLAVLAPLPWLLCRYTERSNQASLDRRQQLRQSAARPPADISLRTGRLRTPVRDVSEK